MRKRYSLGNIDGLGKDVFFEGGAYGCLLHQINLDPAQEILQPVLQVEYLEQGLKVRSNSVKRSTSLV